jgi:hypothetical protein
LVHPRHQPVPTGAGLVHHLQVVDSERLKSATHTGDRIAERKLQLFANDRHPLFMADHLARRSSVVGGQSGVAPGPHVRQEFRVLAATTKGLEQRIALEPVEAREPCIGSDPKPPRRLPGVAKLRVCRAQPVRDMVIAIRAPEHVVRGAVAGVPPPKPLMLRCGEPRTQRAYDALGDDVFHAEQLVRPDSDAFRPERDTGVNIFEPRHDSGVGSIF